MIRIAESLRYYKNILKVNKHRQGYNDNVCSLIKFRIDDDQRVDSITDSCNKHESVGYFFKLSLKNKL